MKQGIGLSGSTPAWVAVIPTCGIVGTRDQDVCGPRVSNDSTASQPDWSNPGQVPFWGMRMAGAPVPTFVSLCSTLSYKRRNQRDTGNYLILVWLWI